MYYSPTFMQIKLRRLKEKYELKEALVKAKRTKVAKVEISKLIDALCLDCDVMLHTSMMKIGKMEGGVKFISEKILDRIDTCKHTLLISALPYRGSFKGYLSSSQPVFDVRIAPIAMGAINEYLAKKPDAVRSIHPTHSVVAIGLRAKEYTASHYLDETPFGEHSPYLKIFKNKGKILLLGATLNNVTANRALEDLLGSAFPINVYDKKVYKLKCYDQEGRELYVSTRCHHPIRCASLDVSVMRKYLEQKNAIEVYPIGEGEVMLIDAALFATCYFDMLAHGISIYGKKHKVTLELQEAIKNAKRTIGIE